MVRATTSPARAAGPSIVLQMVPLIAHSPPPTPPPPFLSHYYFNLLLFELPSNVKLRRMMFSESIDKSSLTQRCNLYSRLAGIVGMGWLPPYM